MMYVNIIDLFEIKKFCFVFVEVFFFYCCVYNEKNE